MLNTAKLATILRQTKLIPPKDIQLMRTIVRKMNNGQKLSLKQKEFYLDVATKLSMEPMLNESAIFRLTRGVLKKKLKGGK